MADVVSRRRSNRNQWAEVATKAARKAAPGSPRKGPKFEQPEAFKTSGGTSWFLVEKPEQRPYTAKGSPRNQAICGIYVDMVGVKNAL